MTPTSDQTIFEAGGRKVHLSDVKGWLAVVGLLGSGATYLGIDQFDLMGVQRTEQHIAHLGGLVTEKETKLQKCNARNDVLLRQLGVDVSGGTPIPESALEVVQ